ncbi:hypothetical protein [Microbacterium sp. CFBP9034]|uniref:hypothetical protein n=1 Tax=Microbacterium sp. CFBP9034 TaxID=3096540 RepID=UPI002A6A559D|nr:hypothetical protein [Microbacterium sp. CFBP9034]MDY0911112.1 hypothetical protein [Microbacterium sp. CFBP9034]
MTADAIHRLELVPLGERTWRVCDHRTTDDQHETLIASVEQLSTGGFETVWVNDLPRVEEFPSLGDVLVAAAHRLSAHRRTDSKPIPIPHRAPIAAR